MVLIEKIFSNSLLKLANRPCILDLLKMCVFLGEWNVLILWIFYLALRCFYKIPISEGFAWLVNDWNLPYTVPIGLKPTQKNGWEYTSRVVKHFHLCQAFVGPLTSTGADMTPYSRLQTDMDASEKFMGSAAVHSFWFGFFKDNWSVPLQIGPLLVMNGVLTPVNGLI